MTAPTPIFDPATKAIYECGDSERVDPRVEAINPATESEAGGHAR